MCQIQNNPRQTHLCAIVRSASREGSPLSTIIIISRGMAVRWPGQRTIARLGFNSRSSWRRCRVVGHRLQQWKLWSCRLDYPCIIITRGLKGSRGPPIKKRVNSGQRCNSHLASRLTMRKRVTSKSNCQTWLLNSFGLKTYRCNHTKMGPIF